MTKTNLNKDRKKICYNQKPYNKFTMSSSIDFFFFPLFNHSKNFEKLLQWFIKKDDLTPRIPAAVNSLIITLTNNFLKIIACKRCLLNGFRIKKKKLREKKIFYLSLKYTSLEMTYLLLFIIFSHKIR